MGKSYLLRFVIEQLKLKYPAAGAVAITAPTGIIYSLQPYSHTNPSTESTHILYVTSAIYIQSHTHTRLFIHNLPLYPHASISFRVGIAALHISGQTIHSFAGIGLGNNSKENLLNKLSALSRSRWAQCKVLVIDEMSMVRSKQVAYPFSSMNSYDFDTSTNWIIFSYPCSPYLTFSHLSTIILTTRLILNYSTNLISLPVVVDRNPFNVFHLGGSNWSCRGIFFNYHQ